MTLTRILAATLFSTLSLSLQAQQPGGGQGGQGGGAGGEHKGPPPAAVDACKGKAADAECSFFGKEGRSVSGKCFAPPAKPDGGKPPMACKPDHAPVGSQHAPPGVK